MRRKIIAFVMFLAVTGAFFLLLRQHLTLEELSRDEFRLRGALARHPLAGFAIGYAVYALVSLVPGTTGKSLALGWLFGLWKGVVLVNLGLTTAAIASFLFSRYLFRDALHRRVSSRLQRLDAAIERDGAFYVFALRMMHAPFTLTNYGMGATGIPTKSFWWSTQLGMLPGNIVFVYAGTQLPTLSQAADEGLWSILSVKLIVAFVLLGVFPLVARWIIRRVF